MGLGSGAVNGELEFGGGFDLQRVRDGGVRTVGGGEAGFKHRGFGFGAAAETPHGAPDFFGETGFEGADRGEFAVEGFAEFGIVGFFAGPDEVTGGEETEFCRVFGGGGFAFFGAGSGGELGVGDVGGLFGC